MKNMKTLWETYFDAFDSACEMPWKVYVRN